MSTSRRRMKGTRKDDGADIKQEASPTVQEKRQPLGKDKGEVEEENREKKNPGKNDFDPDQGRGMKIALDHDQFADVPGDKGKHEEGKDLVYHASGIVEKNNQAESEVDGQSQRCGYGENAHGKSGKNPGG